MNATLSQVLSAEEQAQRAVAVEQSKAQSLATHAARSALRRAQFAEDARVADRFRDIMFAQFSPDTAKLKQLAAEHRRLIEARTKLSPAPSQLRGDRLSPPTAAAAVTRGPPYDETYVTHGQGTETADKNTGAYELRVQSIGNGHQTVGAGIGFWFSSGPGNPAQRFTAVLEFEDDWWDKATGYVAHNDGRTWLTVWGMAENGWVSTSANQTPTWSDGVGWTEAHQNSERGTANLVTFFNARPNSGYFCWVQSAADAYADSGVFGDAFSSIHISNRLAFATFD